MVESALDSETQVPGFVDQLGERFVVPQPSGSLLEYLHFRRDLAAAPFFEPAVKERLTRLANFRHVTYVRVRRLQRAERGALTLVSTHVPGRHLSEVLKIASRNGFRPATAAVLSLTRQLLTAVALLHDYGPDIFHGAIGPERVILGGDGRVVLGEYVLGTAVEQSVRPWGVHHVWRDLRLATLADVNLAGYGRRVDLLQVGLVTLAFLLGRPLTTADFPDGLQQVIEDATELGPDGERVPLGSELKSWIERMVCADPGTAFHSLLEGQKALVPLLAETADSGASSGALEAFLERCESAPWYQPSAEPEPCPDSDVPLAPVEVQEQPVTSAPSSGGVGEQDEAKAALSRDPFGPWPVANPSESAATLFDAFNPSPEARPSAADMVTRAGENKASGPELEARSDAAWVPTPPPEIQTLFEAPMYPPVAPEPPPAPPTPWSHAEAQPAGDQADPGTEPERPSPSAGYAAEPTPPQTQARWGEERQEPEPSRADRQPARQPAVAPTVRRAVAKPRARLTGRIGLVVGLLVVGGLLAVAVPRFWLGRTAPDEAVLVVDSERPASEADAPEAANVGVGQGTQPTRLHITTNPPGGKVSVNGGPSRGTPVRMTDVPPGTYTVSAEGPFGRVEQEVQVAPGEAAVVRVATAGWVRVAAPFDLQVTERGRVFGNTANGPVMVPIGRHHFDLVNSSLALKVRQFVDVTPGQIVAVPFDAGTGMMNLSADQPAEVWLDGALLGQTPLTSVAVPLGPHEVVFRHAKFGEVRYSVEVTLAAPVMLSVTFNKK